MIEVRLSQLLAQLELETGQRPSQRQIAEEIGMAPSTLSLFKQGKLKMYDETLARLVDYFNERLKNGCTLADLIAYPSGDNSPRYPTRTP